MLCGLKPRGFSGVGHFFAVFVPLLSRSFMVSRKSGAQKAYLFIIVICTSCCLLVTSFPFQLMNGLVNTLEYLSILKYFVLANEEKASLIVGK